MQRIVQFGHGKFSTGLAQTAQWGVGTVCTKYCAEYSASFGNLIALECIVDEVTRIAMLSFGTSGSGFQKSSFPPSCAPPCAAAFSVGTRIHKGMSDSYLAWQLNRKQ